MKLSQTKQAIVEKLLMLKTISPNEQYEVILNAALNDYTESIIRMVEGMKYPKEMIDEVKSNPDYWQKLQEHNQALNDIKEELQG